MANDIAFLQYRNAGIVSTASFSSYEIDDRAGVVLINPNTGREWTAEELEQVVARQLLERELPFWARAEYLWAGIDAL